MTTPSTTATKTEEIGDESTALTVFVVDEEEPITRLLSIALGLEGWSVQRFATGTDAVTATIADPPDAILLDMMLPDISGVEVVTEIRAAGVDTPILLLTGRSSLDDRMAAFGAGADDYITKPFALDEVVKSVRATFRRLGKGQAE
jgi:two-component system OmpR family response regulator